MLMESCWRGFLTLVLRRNALGLVAPTSAGGVVGYPVLFGAVNCGCGSVGTARSDDGSCTSTGENDSQVGGSLLNSL